MGTSFVILASGSPRREALLRQIGVAFEIERPVIAEARLPGEAPAALVERLARAKADAVWPDAAGRGAPVLAADTAVVVDGDVLGKPGSRRAATAMLERLSGSTHEVFTAVAVRDGARVEARLSVSKVRFRATTAAERAAYCASGEPFDKAGAYAIQGRGAVFVEHLSGSYSGVMGLPIAETAELLERFALPAWRFECPKEGTAAGGP